MYKAETEGSFGYGVLGINLSIMALYGLMMIKEEGKLFKRFDN
jgi:hypothetical protein